MTDQKYPAHGSVRQRREGQILVADLYGPWNLECMQGAVHSADPMVDEMLRNGPVGILVIAHGSILGTREALTEIRERSLERRDSVNQIFVAWVAGPGVEGGQMMTSVLDETYRDALPMRTFADVAAAREWLTSMLQRRRAANDSGAGVAA